MQCSFQVETAMFFVHMENYKESITSYWICQYMRSKQIQPSLIFLATFSRDLQLIIKAPVIYIPHGCCLDWSYHCSNCLVLYLQDH